MFLFWLIADFDPHNYCLSWSLNFGKRQARHRDRFNSLPDVRVLSGHWTVAVQVKIGLSRPVFSGTSGRTRSSPRGFSRRDRNPAPLSCNLQRNSAGDRVFNWPGVLQAQVRVCGDARGESAVPLAPATSRVSSNSEGAKAGGTGRRRAAALLRPVSAL